MKKFFLILGVLPFLAIGCQKKAPPVYHDRININIVSDPATLDPRKGGDLVSSLFHFLFFDGLVRLDDEGKPSPSLAKHIEISEDQTVYTFTLHECYWSDGTPITAWDFEKSWKDILHPDFPAMSAHLLYPIKNAEGAKKGITSLSEVGIRSLDARTLEVTLAHPVPYFLEIVSFCVFFPVNAEVDHSHPDWDQASSKHFVCSGPFLLKEWKRNNEIILKKNPLYFKADGVALEEIHIHMVNSESTSLQMYEKGEIDILGQPLLPLPTDAIPELKKKGELFIHPVPATTFCTFNTESFPFNNKNIRKAFAYTINRRQIVQNITQLEEIPALGAIAPVLKKSEAIPFYRDADVETAKAHFKQGLEELGITAKEFPRIKHIYSTAESHRKIAQALQQQWFETLGIMVELESIDKKILMQNLKTGSYQMALTFWMAQYNDPMNILERFKYKDNVKNYPNWENEAYKELINRSFETTSDEQRAQILHEAETIFMEEMPLAPIFHWNSAYIKKPYIKSFSLVPIGDVFLDRVYIDHETKGELR
ncbi:MAG: Oligopeptide-binding protein OppA [Chlamydiae bacterium]|nr:Oligopeptide-binding protein OppA [Chlamydiota bacterium]